LSNKFVSEFILTFLAETVHDLSPLGGKQTTFFDATKHSILTLHCS